jgi:hypothetical protein
VTDAQNEYYEPIMLERTDEAVVTDTVFPELAQRAFEYLPNLARVVEFGDPLVKELRDTTSDRFV